MTEPLKEERRTGSERRRPFETYDLTVEIADLVTPRNKHLRFRLPKGKEIHFEAGQFVQMFIPDNGKTRRTSYSLASSPEHREYFELCVTLVDGGKSSTFLHGLKVGDRIQGLGPLGKFRNPGDREPVFIATGSGIAPFRSMIYDLVHRGYKGSMHLIFGNRFEPDIIYRKEWEDLAKKSANFKPLFTLSRDQNWTGPRGYVQDKILGVIPDATSKNFFICGLNNMITAVQDKLLSMGVPQNQILFERYD